MRCCPAGHPTAADDWCDVCGRLVAPVPGACPDCSATPGGRFCDECGADTALPAPALWVATDADWFAHVRTRAGERVADRRLPSTPPRRVRLDHRRVVLGRRRPGTPAPDVDLDDDGVSARHAVLLCDGDGWNLVDLGSRNGTAVGSFATVPPRRPVPVPPGAVVRLGLWTCLRIDPAG